MGPCVGRGKLLPRAVYPSTKQLYTSLGVPGFLSAFWEFPLDLPYFVTEKDTIYRFGRGGGFLAQLLDQATATPTGQFVSTPPFPETRKHSKRQPQTKPTIWRTCPAGRLLLPTPGAEMETLLHWIFFWWGGGIANGPAAHALHSFGGVVSPTWILM